MSLFFNNMSENQTSVEWTPHAVFACLCAYDPVYRVLYTVYVLISNLYYLSSVCVFVCVCVCVDGSCVYVFICVCGCVKV